MLQVTLIILHVKEAIKPWFEEMFVLCKVKTQSITHTRIKS